MVAFIYLSLMFLAEAGHGSEAGSFMNFYNEYLNRPGFEAWKFLNLAIFVAVLVYLLRKPLSDAFKAKRDAIRSELIKAEEEKQAALKRLGEVEARLASLEGDVQAILKRANDEAAEDKDRLGEQTEFEIKRLREQGTTVFLTTHYLEEADALADRLAIIDHGKIVAEGTSSQLKQKVAGDVVTIGVDGSGANVLTLVEAMPFVREASHDSETGLIRLYVDRGETAVPHLLRSLDAAGYEPTSISLNKPSLDDVFLRQTGRSLREEAA